MVMTGEGPVSMCEVNSRRDDDILGPASLVRAGSAPRGNLPSVKNLQVHPVRTEEPGPLLE
jgi:hypothetical protein